MVRPAGKCQRTLGIWIDNIPRRNAAIVKGNKMEAETEQEAKQEQEAEQEPQHQ